MWMQIIIYKVTGCNYLMWRYLVFLQIQSENQKIGDSKQRTIKDFNTLSWEIYQIKNAAVLKTCLEYFL